VVWDGFIATPQIRWERAAMVWQWLTGPARASRTRNTCSFIRLHLQYLAPKVFDSEAVRGEGGVLITPEGKPFMMSYSAEWGDLAPRDVVAAPFIMRWNITATLMCCSILLHACRRSVFASGFPNIYSRCLKAHRHPSEPIPVVPAATTFAAACWLMNGVVPAWRGYMELAKSVARSARRQSFASTSLLEGLVWEITPQNY